MTKKAVLFALWLFGAVMAPLYAASAEEIILGEATLSVPQQWQITDQRRDVEVGLAGPAGESLRVYWWFPDEPLLGYDGQISHETRSFAAGPALVIRSRSAGRSSVQVAFERESADGERLLFLIESETDPTETLEAILEPFLQGLRFSGDPEPVTRAPSPPDAGDWHHDAAGNVSFQRPDEWKVYGADLPGVRRISVLAPGGDAIVLVAVSDDAGALDAYETRFYQDEVIPRQIDDESHDAVAGIDGHAITVSARIYGVGDMSLPYSHATAWIFRGEAKGKAVMLAFVHAADAADDQRLTLRAIAESFRVGPPPDGASATGGPVAAAPQDAITRVYVFETCLPGPDTVSISVMGLPSFHEAGPVQSLLDAIDMTPGEGSKPCGAANLPKGAVIGAPEKGRRADSDFTLYVEPQEPEGWTAQSYSGHSFALPTGWTGGDNGQGALVFQSSTGQYQIAFSHTPQLPAPRGERAEVRFADGTRFLKLKEVEGETLISAAPADPDGHLVIGVTGGEADNETFANILATLRFAAPPVTAAQPASALDGVLTYTVPDGWQVLVDSDSLTFMADDGRGFLTVAKGAAVLPPHGLAAQVPPGRLGSYAESHSKEWTQFGWPGTAAEFMDGDQADNGWYFLNILRGCLPQQEPVAIAWGGISRFLDGEALKDLNRSVVFAWPEAMEDCQLENAGVGQAAVDPAPEGQPVVPAPVPDPAVAAPDVTAPEETAPAAIAPSAVEPAPPAQAQAPLVPPPPPVAAEEAGPDPDSFTEGEGGYTLYENARYGTFISYPASYYSAMPAPDSGDGRTFVSADGASRFVVFAQYNALGLSQAEMMQDDIATGGYDDVTYQKQGEGWYVLSGYAANDIFYRKVILDPSGLIQVFEISYPGSLKQSFDPVVSYMVQTFGPGTSPGVEPSVLAQPEGLPGVQVDKLKTPARNTALRSALMDAARVPIEAEIGRKVIFVVSVLRTDDTWAYLQAVPRNPDGSAINWAKTPFAKEMKQGVMSDVAMVLMRQIGGRWDVVSHVFGPTDVYWYAWLDEFNLPEQLFTP